MLLASISEDTLKTYERLWEKFYHWCLSRKEVLPTSLPLVCDFLVAMYQKGYSSSYLNSIRSSLNFFLPEEVDLGSNPIILRLFKGFYKERPSRPKYFVFWPVEKVINLLASWHPASSLDLKHLTLKTLALIALSSSDRGQTLHALDVENTVIENNEVTFLIFKTLKTTKRSSKPKTVKCISNENDSLNVGDYVLRYMNRTFAARASAVRKGLPKPTQFFISWKTKSPVSKKTIARWLTTVLQLAEIDTGQFKAHSYRGSGLSAALKRGATATQILQAGDWTNIHTFNHHYNAPSINSNVGKIILQQQEVKFDLIITNKFRSYT